MPTDRPEPASPACLAHEANDGYMGYATKDELAAFLNSVFGYCLGCQLYLLLVRARLIRRPAA